MYFQAVLSANVLKSMLYMEHAKHGDDFLKSIISSLGFKALKELGYYIYHNSGHCTHNPVNWLKSKEIASLYGKNKMAVLLGDPVPLSTIMHYIQNHAHNCSCW